MLGIPEAHVRTLELAEPFDVHLVGAVDQDVADGRIRKERRQRPHADRLVGQLLGQPDALRLVERHLLRRNRTRREILYGRRDVGAFVLEQPAFANFVQEPLLQGRLHSEVVGSSGLGDLRRAIHVLSRRTSRPGGDILQPRRCVGRVPRESPSIDGHSISF
jgi:hypothetical protein